MNKQVKESLLALAIISASSQVLAIEPASVDLGGFYMIPTVSLTTGYDDNPFSQTTNNPNDSFVTVVNPSVGFLAEQNKNIYSLNVGVTRGVFHDSTADNYTDSNIDATADLFFNSKNGLVLNFSYLDSHEDRGSGSTQGIADFIAGPTEFHDTSFSAKYTYGAATAKGRLQLSADYLSKVFDNFITLNQNRERKDYAVGAKLLYAVSADTDVTVEARSIVIDYNRQEALRDSDEMEYFVGLEWQATAKTSGYAKIGVGDKEFDSVFNTTDPGTEASWDLGLVWEPRTYSSFTLTTSREEEETPSTGDFVDTRFYGISWNHSWTEQISTNLGYNLLDQDYVGSLQDDDIDSFSAGIKYAYDRWLDIGLTFDYSDKSSTINNTGPGDLPTDPTLEFDRTKVMLSFDVSL